jgi:hypothetical protein
MSQRPADQARRGQPASASDFEDRRFDRSTIQRYPSSQAPVELHRRTSSAAQGSTRPVARAVLGDAPLERLEFSYRSPIAASYRQVIINWALIPAAPR